MITGPKGPEEKEVETMLFLIIQFLAALTIAVAFLRRGAIGQLFGKDAGVEGDEMIKSVIKTCVALFIGAETIGAPMQQVTIVAAILRGIVTLIDTIVGSVPGGAI